MNSVSIGHYELPYLLFAVVALLLAANILGRIAVRLALPRVTGEILGGILLGPTVFGRLAPGTFREIFFAFPEEPKLLALFYWLGLLLLMFVSGFEMEPSFSKEDRRTVTALLAGATLVPFVAAWWLTGVYDIAPYLGERHNMFALRLIIAISFAVTSIPVISKIFIDLKILDTKFARIVLATATVEDLILLVTLSFALSVVTSEPTTASSFGSVLLSVAIFLLIPVFVRMVGWCYRVFRPSPSVLALTLCFMSAAVVAFFNVNVIFGAFIAGIVVGLLPRENFGSVKRHISEVGLAFFIPIYFALVGFRLDLGRHFDAMFLFEFVTVSMLVKGLGVVAVLWLLRKSVLTMCNMAFALNARGGPGIVIATAAFDAGIIDQVLFTTLIMTALVTSVLAGVWLRVVLNRGLPLYQ